MNSTHLTKPLFSVCSRFSALLTLASIFLYAQNPKLSWANTLCNSDFAQTQEECNALELWRSDNFSDASSLDKDLKFKIIFHSITGHDKWTRKLLANPALLADNPQISASLISEEKHSTFIGIIGFILEVPPENLAGTSPKDLGSFYVDYSFLVKSSQWETWDILTPEKLLNLTPAHKYNELIITGTHPRTNTSVKVKGVMLNCPFDTVTSLNNLSWHEFTTTLDKCSSSSFPIPAYTRALLEKLRTQYPVYGYRLIW